MDARYEQDQVICLDRAQPFDIIAVFGFARLSFRTGTAHSALGADADE